MNSLVRREFLRSAVGTAALTLTSRSSAFGQSRNLGVSFHAAAPNLPDRPAPDWNRRKIAQVQQAMAKRSLDALVLLSAPNVIYTTGYFHLSTERPLAALIPKTGDPALFIPDLESDQVKLWWVKDYEAYFDFPGPVNRLQWIFERVAKRGYKRIGIEEARPSRLQHMKDGAPKVELVPADEIIERMRWVKDDD